MKVALFLWGGGGFPGEQEPCCFDVKRNENVIVMSTMHHKADTDENVKKKPEIVKYNNETKGGVDTFVDYKL